MEDKNYIIIKSPEEYKDSFLCFCTFMRFMEEAGEDYIDYNEKIINPYPFSMWLFGKGYISNEQIEELFDNDNLYLGKVLQSDILFPKTDACEGLAHFKAYSLLAEYMSSLSELRQRLYDSVNNKATMFTNDEFYKDEDGVSLACIVFTEELEDNVHDIDEVDVYNLTYREQWDLVTKMSIAEADEASCDEEE